MTAMPAFDRPQFEAMDAAASVARTQNEVPRRYAVCERSWGYVVRPEEGMSLPIAVGQIMSWVVGLSFVTAALALWIFPGSFSPELATMKLGLSSAMLGVGGLLLWFASRGAMIEIQIDTNRGEVREVVCNRTGRETILGTYGFDAIGDARIEDAADMASDQLVLSQRIGVRDIAVANGPRHTLTDLKDRIGRDLLGSSATVRRHHRDFVPLNPAA